MNDKYKEFLDYCKKVRDYEKVLVLMEWDLQTQTPKTGVDGLVDTLGTMSEQAYTLKTSKEMGDLLEELTKSEIFDSLNEEEQIVVKKSKEDYELNKLITPQEYKEYSVLTAKATDVWQQAKKSNDYKTFEPYLEKVIHMTKKMAEAKAEYLKMDVYDVLLNENEEGMLSETIDKLFEDVKKELIPLVKKIIACGERDASKFKGDFNIEDQKQFCEYLLEYIGFSMDAGVAGVSEHPFTTALSKSDVRLTDHYESSDIIDALFSMIHEGGHGIFEQNVSDSLDETPLYSCRYLGLHESQSRFFENILGRNINFWKPVYRKLTETFPQYENISLDEFYLQINNVRNTLIRTSSDEVTYCFHIIIRYEIERDLFAGKISVKELPQVWNEKVQEYLGITPEKDSEGILQDTHWSGGAFGYFPSYLLGSIYDGMFLEKIEEELGDIDEILAKGEIKKITKWLNENIHQYGSSRTPKEVIESVCGKEVSAKPLMDYFKKKYSGIYKI